MAGTSPFQLDEATLDLLIKQVTEGLSPAEQRALDVLGEAVSAHLHSVEQAVAAVTLAGAVLPLPAALAQRLSHQADQYLAAGGSAGPAAIAAAAVHPRVVDLDRARAAAATPAARPAPAQSRSGRYGWFAAAACLLLAIFGWVRSPAPPVAEVAAPTASPTAPPASMPDAAPSVAPSTAQERLALLAKPGTLKITLAPTKDPAGAGVTGDVVWDPDTQRGYMHFAGLAANDPAVRQYQLWIFDGDRDQRYPVDGGVFDVPSTGGEVVIPIRAALMVRKPAAFAVTLEKPGGAVVSGREHIVVLGAAS
jgi:hypothetical protein